jgi:predicted dehydrogenase
MIMGKIGTAVVGAGFIGPVHVEALKRLNIHVTGILGVNDDESQRAMTQLELPKAYRDFDEVLADDKVQAVHIATPNFLHYNLAKRALNGGKHVLCEKPLAMNSTESAELVTQARQTGRVAGVNYNIRYYPLCLEMREMVRSGELGEIFTVCGSYVQDWLLYETDYNWRVLAEDGGELRAIADIGTHWLDLVQAITGRDVESVCADLKTVHPIRRRPRGEVETFTGKGAAAAETEAVAVSTEDSGSVMLHFAGGARGNLFVSQCTAGRKNCLRLEIAGSKRAVAWESERPNELWIGHRDRPNELMLRDPSLASAAARPFMTLPGGHNEGFTDTFKQCFRSFYTHLQWENSHSQSPLMFPTFADGHREILLCEAIARSHRERRWITIENRET